MAKFESKGTWFETHATDTPLDDRQAFQASFAGSLTLACGCCREKPANMRRMNAGGPQLCDYCMCNCPIRGGQHITTRGPQKWCAVCRGEGDRCEFCCLPKAEVSE
jgi:hypothetical protein